MSKKNGDVELIVKIGEEVRSVGGCEVRRR